MFLGLIPIVYERSKNEDNKDKNLKDNIYYLALKTMLQYRYPLSKCNQLSANNILYILFQEIYKEDIEIWHADGCKR